MTRAASTDLQAENDRLRARVAELEGEKVELIDQWQKQEARVQALDGALTRLICILDDDELRESDLETARAALATKEKP